MEKEYYMREALKEAKKAFDKEEVPVGAVIVKDGKIIEPDSPNAYKFEAFLFDAFGEVDEMAVLRVKREEEFAPIKNAEGADSPETARKMYLDYWKKKKTLHRKFWGLIN